MKARRLREYEPIWNTIKSRPAGEVTAVRIHKNAVKTLIQAVRKEKAYENALRVQLGMTSDGKLDAAVSVDKTDPNFHIVKFTLQWSYRDL